VKSQANEVKAMLGKLRLNGARDYLDKVLTPVVHEDLPVWIFCIGC
jgi:hypothetical protein